MHRLTVIGAGYLGAVHAACLAEVGFEVLGTDIDPTRVLTLNQGRAPFREPGLDRLLRRGLRSGRLRFTTSLPEAARFGDVHFLCVGTPQRDGHPGADLSQLYACVDALAPLLQRPCLIAGKSTTPVGTAAALADRLAALAPVGSRAELAWNPEFVREGHAVADTLRPERIVVGVRSVWAETMLRDVYRKLTDAGAPLLVTDLATAELAKAAANAFLATKISFINAMAEMCEAAGADVTVLADVLGRDSRIGAAGMRPGLGFGGGCLPKDIKAFRQRATELGAGPALSFLCDVESVNLRCRSRAVAAAADLAGGSLEGQVVGVLGAAFKPDSDDIRESPALAVAVAVHRLGAQVTVYDPAAAAKAVAAYPQLRQADTAEAAARDADVLLVLTEWDEFRSADPEIIGKAVRQRNVLDTRHALDHGRWRAAGWTYRALGRS
jgi:UDPglucose 6-dehydrogenase